MSNYGAGHATNNRRSLGVGDHGQPGVSIGGSKTANSERPDIDLDVAALRELAGALEHLNQIGGPITLERVTIGKNVVQLKKRTVASRGGDADTAEYMIVGIWPAGAKEGVTR